MELNSVFSVGIPNSLLVVPQATVTDDGSIFTNASALQVQIIPAPGGEGGTFILGRPFFSSAYLSVDYDAGTFTLWESNVTEDTDLVAFGGNCSAPIVNAPPNNSTSTTGPSPTHTQSSHGRVGTGAIVGASIGSAIVAATFGAAAVLWYVRKRRREDDISKKRTSMSSEPRRQMSHPDMTVSQPYEAMSGEMQEMGAVQDPLELHAETDPTELSNENANRVRQKRLLEGCNSPVELA